MGKTMLEVENRVLDLLNEGEWDFSDIDVFGEGAISSQDSLQVAHALANVLDVSRFTHVFGTSEGESHVTLDNGRTITFNGFSTGYNGTGPRLFAQAILSFGFSEEDADFVFESDIVDLEKF